MGGGGAWLTPSETTPMPTRQQQAPGGRGLQGQPWVLPSEASCWLAATGSSL